MQLQRLRDPRRTRSEQTRAGDPGRANRRKADQATDPGRIRQPRPVRRKPRRRWSGKLAVLWKALQSAQPGRSGAAGGIAAVTQPASAGSISKSVPRLRRDHVLDQDAGLRVHHLRSNVTRLPKSRSSPPGACRCRKIGATDDLPPADGALPALVRQWPGSSGSLHPQYARCEHPTAGGLAANEHLQSLAASGVSAVAVVVLDTQTAEPAGDREPRRQAKPRIGSDAQPQIDRLDPQAIYLCRGV